MKLLYFFFIFSVCLSAQWQPVIPYPTLNHITYIKGFSDSDYVICTSKSGYTIGFEIFITSDTGNKWESVFKDTTTLIYNAFFLNKDYGWIYSRYYDEKIWRTTDGGHNWVSSNIPENEYFKKVIFLDKYVGFLTGFENIFKTTDGGQSWIELYGDSIGGFYSISVLNEDFIACAGKYIRITTDGGNTWSIYSDSTLYRGFYGIYFLDSLNGYAMTYGEMVVIKTTDGGKNWYRIINYLVSDHYYSDAKFFNNTGVIAYGAYEDSETLFITTDKGETWLEKTVGVAVNSISFINDSTFILAGRNGLMYKTTDFGTTFNIIGKEKIYGISGLSFSKEGYGYVNSSYLSLLHTSDNGETFVKTDRPPMKEIAAIGDSIVIGLGGNNIFRSTNKGVDWNQIIISPSPGQMWKLSFPTDTTGYFTAYSGIYKTTDAGESWFRISSMRQRAISFTDDKTGYVVNDHIYKTTDGGISWQQQAYVYYGHSISMLNSDIGAAGFDNIYYTYDGGENWQQAVLNGVGGLSELWEIEVFNHNGHIIGCAYFFDTGRIFYSVDNLKTWNKDTGFPGIWSDQTDKIPFLHYDGKTLWAGTEKGYLLKRDNFDDLITSADESVENKIPYEFILFQNYPNPFNPTTTFKFSLPETEYVTLKIYDVLGSEVTTVIQDILNAGEYKYYFNGSDLSSGIYFYKLTAGSYTSIMKMQLLK